MRFCLRIIFLVGAIAFLGGAPNARADSSATTTNQRVFEVKGVIKELKPDGKTVVIQHQEITNYMAAMTMPFEVKNTNELHGLNVGDVIMFHLIDAGSDAWIEQIKGLSTTNRPAPTPAIAPTFRLVRDVDPLSVGDVLPEYHFTNELGKAINTKDFKGQAFAFTFIFTRCPYPLFCPLMSKNFQATQSKLLALPDAPRQWHLFSISFDPRNDTPAVLSDYATHYSPDPNHWSFITGDLVDITALGDQFNEYFGPDGSGGVQHNLRTVVIDARGRVSKIFTDNKWTSDDLVAEILKAAARK